MATEHNLILKVASKAQLGVRQLSAHDQMGRPFQVDLLAQSKNTGKSPTLRGPAIDLEAIIGQGASVRVTQDNGEVHVWTGICSHIEQIRYEEQLGGMSTYYVRVVPFLWLLSQRRGHRIYQHQTIPEIVKALFAEWKLECEWRVDDSKYIKKEYCVQYDETDLDFVHRLLEEAGIVYYFDQKESKKELQSFIVLSDATTSQKPSVDIQYAANPNETGGTKYATRVYISHGVRSGRVQIADFNFRRPKSPLFAQSVQIDGEEGSRELYHYDPGAFLIESGGPGEGPGDEKVADNKSTTIHDHEKEGLARAQRFLEAARHKKRYVAFETSHQDLAVGKVVTIYDHPHGELDEQPLLVIESMTQVSAVGQWSVVVETAFCDVPYRQPRTTPKPIVRGVQSAIVTGPKGEEIYTDEFGRVRVHFHWDREGEFDDKATGWLRVAQTWAGAQYGAMTVPRIGHEVIVDFMEGDPDQPIIVGRVHTGVAPPPYKLPDHKTRSGWQTNTTPNQKETPSFNELSFEDATDKELVYLQAQRNFMSLTKRDETERTGKQRLSVVGKHQLGVVGQVDSHHFGERKLVRMVSTSEKDLKILELGNPATNPKDTWIEVQKPSKITLTTGGKKATIVLDGPNITVESHGGIRMSADRLFIIKGSMVYINAKPGDDAKPKTKQKIKDEAPVPEGDILNSVAQIFSKAEAPETDLDLDAVGAKKIANPTGAQKNTFDETCPKTNHASEYMANPALPQPVKDWFKKHDGRGTVAYDRALGSIGGGGFLRNGGMSVKTLSGPMKVYRYVNKKWPSRGGWWGPIPVANPVADLALPEYSSAYELIEAELPAGETIEVLEGPGAPRCSNKPGGPPQWFVPHGQKKKLKILSREPMPNFTP